MPTWLTNDRHYFALVYVSSQDGLLERIDVNALCSTEICVLSLLILIFYLVLGLDF